MTRSLYAVLNVAPDADPAVIEAAYKALMKKYHPDVLTDEPESVQRFAADINHAFNILKDPAKRAQYDSNEARQETVRRTAFTLAEAQRAYQPPPMPRRPRRKWPALITIAAVALLVFFIWRGADPSNGGGAGAEAASRTTGTTEGTGGELAPVRVEDIDRAIAEFRRIRNRSGLLGLSGYSHDCFAAQSRSAKASDFDFCVAFDRAAASYSEAKPGYYYLPQLPRFQPRELGQRHAAAGSLLSGNEDVIEARVATINQLASRRLEAGREKREPAPTVDVAVPREPRYAPPRRTERVAEAPKQRRRPAQQRRQKQTDRDFLEREGYIY